jgi:hypothetical protein
MFVNRRGVLLSAAGLVCALFCGAPAKADVLFTYNGFANTSGLNLFGNAGTAVTSDGTVLRVAPATTNQSGAAYNTTAVPLVGNTFSSVFDFRITDAGGIDPADGFTFVVAGAPSGLGGIGQSLGYEGASANSMAIEFDTFDNGGADGNSSNHVGIDIGGVLTDLDLNNVYGNQTCDFGSSTSYLRAGCLSNGDLWRATINYDGSNLFVTLNDPSEGSSFTAINSFPIDIASILGSSQAFVGFTSATGGGFENHDITYWQVSNAAAAVPEPSSTLLSGIAVLGLGWFAYRKCRPATKPVNE